MNSEKTLNQIALHKINDFLKSIYQGEHLQIMHTKCHDNIPSMNSFMHQVSVLAGNIFSQA